MKTTIMKPIAPLESPRTRVRYRAATAIATSSSQRPDYAIGFDRLPHMQITKCDVLYSEYPTYLQLHVTDIECNGEATYVEVDITITPRIIYVSSYDTRGECIAQYHRIAEPHNSGCKLYNAFTPKTAINLENEKTVTTITPAVMSAIEQMLYVHDDCGYAASNTWGESEMRMYSRGWIHPTPLRKSLTDGPVTQFGIASEDARNCVWNAYEWSAYHKPSQDEVVDISARVFRDATPFFIGGDIRLGTHRILGQTLTKPTREIVEALMEQNDTTRLLVQGCHPYARHGDVEKRAFSDIISRIEHTFILDTDNHMRMDNRGFMHESTEGDE